MAKETKSGVLLFDASDVHVQVEPPDFSGMLHLILKDRAAAMSPKDARDLAALLRKNAPPNVMARNGKTGEVYDAIEVKAIDEIRKWFTVVRYGLVPCGMPEAVARALLYETAPERPIRCGDVEFWIEW